MKVLIYDNADITRKIIKKYIFSINEQAEVFETRYASEAIRFIKSDKLSIVIIDAENTLMKALKIREVVMDYQPDCKIIMLHAYPDLLINELNNRNGELIFDKFNESKKYLENLRMLLEKDTTNKNNANALKPDVNKSKDI